MIIYNQKETRATEKRGSTMNKTLVFDMDGTIANLYGVDGWLEMLRNEDTTPYAVCEPLVNMEELTSNLTKLQKKGYKVVVTTWTAKNGSKEYNKATAKVKKEWLNNYNFPYNEFHAVKYGTTKLNATRKHGGFQILFDDCDNVRKGWNGGLAINPITTNINKYLKTLI